MATKINKFFVYTLFYSIFQVMKMYGLVLVDSN